MDCNEDVRRHTISTWLQEVELMDCVLEKHERNNAPPTYNRGSKPIDGMFCSTSLQVTACGYLPFGHFPSDHRGVWVDITYGSAFGHHIPKCIQPAARRLKCNDPRIAAKWVDAYEHYI